MRCVASDRRIHSNSTYKRICHQVLKERHDLAQLYFDMVECVLRTYRKKTGLSETEEDLTDLYKSQLNRLGLVALNGLLNDKLDLNENELGNHAKDLTEFGFLA